MARDKWYVKNITSARWRRLRNSVLEAHPLCVECEREGRVTAATEVHHITPVETAINDSSKERLMYSAANLSPLCHDCHAKMHGRGKGHGKEWRQRRNFERNQLAIRALYGAGGQFFKAPPGGL